MNSVKATYERLAKAGRSSVLLAADHVVYLMGHALFVEHYRRFYFHDIHALVIQRTHGRAVRNAAFAAVLLLCITGFALGAAGLRIFGGIVGVGAAVLMAVNTLRGPACRTRVITRMSDTAVAPLSRLRVAERVVARLEPLIRAAQPHQPAQELPALVVAAEPAPVPGRLDHFHRPAHGMDPAWHVRTALVYGLYGLAEVLNLTMHSTALAVVLSGIFMMALAATVATLVRQYGSSLSSGLKSWTWMGIGVLVALYSVSYGYSMVGMLAEGSGITSQWKLYRSMLATPPTSSLWLTVFSLFSAAALGGLCVSGLMLARRQPAADRPGPPEMTA